jgi:hypothetical protein
MKLEDENADWFAGGHRTDPLKRTFTQVVSMKQSAFILARMNGLQVCAGMLEMLSYMENPRKKVFVIAGRNLAKTQQNDY